MASKQCPKQCSQAQLQSMSTYERTDGLTKKLLTLRENLLLANAREKSQK